MDRSARIPFQSKLSKFSRFRFTLVWLSLLLALVVLCEAPCYGASKALRVVVLTDAAGLGDKGFNDVCWRGVERARAEFGLSAQFLQSREQADYLSNLTLATQYGDVVVTLGFLYTDAVKQFVPRFPESRFIHIEGEIEGENIASFDFKSEEGGFLAGVCAGLFTKAKKVGVVSGMDIPPVEAYLSGFRAGIKTAEKQRGEEIELIVTSVGSFNDPVKGKALAQALIEKGADVIFRLAGNSGIGVLEAVKDTKGVYLIAEDLDLDAEYPGKVLTSTLKRMDVAVYEAIRSIVRGELKGGHRWLGIREGAVGITEMKYSSQLYSAIDLRRIAKARELLEQNKLSVPKRGSEVEAFQPPEL